MSREAAITVFLEAAGWGGARREPLAGDASARRYERLRRGVWRAILMDAPPESGLRAEPFLAVARWLSGHGFSAPEVFAADPEAGLVLLEDLGDGLVAALSARDPAREPMLYAASVDTLATLHALPPPDGDWTPPPYDMAVLMREARLTAEWYVPAASGGAVAADALAEFEALAEAAFAPVLPGSTAPVYRDYHAENLIWLPDRAGHARIGLLDFQDMLVGHPAYDLASLLRDARRDIGDVLAARMRARYLAATGLDAEMFDRAAHALSAQRNLKLLGLFTRLCRRDGKARYVEYLPRVWRYLEGDLAHPALAELRGWVARHVPAPDEVARTRIAARAA